MRKPGKHSRPGDLGRQDLLCYIEHVLLKDSRVKVRRMASTGNQEVMDFDEPLGHLLRNLELTYNAIVERCEKILEEEKFASQPPEVR